MGGWTIDELMYITAGGFTVLLADPGPVMSDIGSVTFGAVTMLSLYYVATNGDSDE